MSTYCSPLDFPTCHVCGVKLTRPEMRTESGCCVDRVWCATQSARRGVRAGPDGSARNYMGPHSGDRKQGEWPQNGSSDEVAEDEKEQKR